MVLPGLYFLDFFRTHHHITGTSSAIFRYCTKRPSQIIILFYLKSCRDTILLVIPPQVPESSLPFTVAVAGVEVRKGCAKTERQ